MWSIQNKKKKKILVLKLDSDATVVIGMLMRSHAIKKSSGNPL